MGQGTEQKQRRSNKKRRLVSSSLMRGNLEHAKRGEMNEGEQRQKQETVRPRRWRGGTKGRRECSRESARAGVWRIDRP